MLPFGIVDDVRRDQPAEPPDDRVRRGPRHPIAASAGERQTLGNADPQAGQYSHQYEVGGARRIARLGGAECQAGAHADRSRRDPALPRQASKREALDDSEDSSGGEAPGKCRREIVDASGDGSGGETGDRVGDEARQPVRSAMIENREIASLVIARPNVGPNSIRIGEYGFGLLRRAGFADDAVELVLNSVLTYTLGFVALEVPRTEGADGVGSISASLDGVYGTLDRTEFSHTFAVKPAPGALVSQHQFDFGLDALLDGIGLRQGGSTSEAQPNRRR